MPVSHLTLTVSNLPQSTSFFLSCLQPLGYRFIGRHENSIGFGAEPGQPADFWIAEERPGVPAGAAHIAFPAPSHDAVGAFFIAALKAGGKIHGEPCLRDADQGYYSAAVIDFDGNSIEAVHRARAAAASAADDRALTVVDRASYVSRAVSTKSSSRVPKSEVGSVARRSSVSVAKSRTLPSIERTAVAKSTVSVAKQPPAQTTYQQQPQQSTASAFQQPAQSSVAKPVDNLSGAKAVVGTLLGAAAGAAIAYAMVKGESPPTEPAPPRYTEEPLAYAANQAPSEYKALGPPQRSMSVDDGISAYARTTYSKNPRASTIFEGIEQCTQLLSKAATLAGGGNNLPQMQQLQQHPEMHRSSSGSIVYATGEMPLRAIEGIPDDYDGASEFPYNNHRNPSTFISSFTERPRRRFEEDRRSSYSGQSGSSSVMSSSTIKPPKSSHSRPASSHRSHSSRSVITINDIYDKAPSTTASGYYSARNIPLPSGSVTTITSTTTTSSSKAASRNSSNSKRSTTTHSSAARHVPLPASIAGTSTIFLDDVDVDSHVTLPTVLPDGGGSRASRKTTTTTTSSRRRRSRSGSRRGSTVSLSASSLRGSGSGSKFDEPVLPSDSVSQIGSNVSRKSGRSRK
ncbi:hypothetical protein LOZ12_005842 [Ophidiomyces ophidiicola]|uniref:Uncharacterized protein n=1 Tax=Ophidiomyces ophidiicola TaxID=1387563 RepID=A0ACB8UP12_9EURO|nr:hypothetical protein LOZ64_006345 [Ophidiomyces ophidiicola]KAI1933498.1 hypothetical protein LOZ62_006450 [Ophidiomyces ophidiicola]KAI2017103.1 hypothetical protein LOZ45_006392 [Ophidiomyces ophidiicola]KAI2031143.1 hypothetical protein LOZ47_006229 [Ophidiomyces ophidiicola]KAI2042433.1 hypothetical protein LOZ44_006107 [Ophidiomyces ophidiicola]